VDLNTLPRREADNSIVIDTETCLCKSYMQEGAIKIIKRSIDTVERQQRLCLGQLPVAYRFDSAGHRRYLYILDGALTTYSDNANKNLEGLIPPCIISSGTGGVQIMLEFEDRSDRVEVRQINADSVTLAIRAPLDALKAKEEIFEFLAKTLRRRWAQFALMRGFSARSKVLVVDNMTPEQAFAALEKVHKKGLHKREAGGGFRRRRGRGRGGMRLL